MLWVGSSGGGVGVPCGVAWGAAILINGGGFVWVHAVVSSWGLSHRDGLSRSDQSNKSDLLEHF